MTIKRRLIISYISMLIISFMSLVLFSRIVMIFLYETEQPSRETIIRFLGSHSTEKFLLIWLLGMTFFITVISIINNLYTYRMIKHIITPLEMLKEGVRQIGDSNYT